MASRKEPIPVPKGAIKPLPPPSPPLPTTSQILIDVASSSGTRWCFVCGEGIIDRTFMVRCIGGEIVLHRSYASVLAEKLVTAAVTGRAVY